MWLLLAECHLTNWGDSPFRPGVVSDNQLDTVGDFKRCIQLCSTTPVTAHRQMLLRRMFCGGLLISPHPVAAHHSTSSSATLNSRRHCYSRGLPRHRSVQKRLILQLPGSLCKPLPSGFGASCARPFLRQLE